MLRLRGEPFCTAAVEYLDHDPAGHADEPHIYLQVGTDLADFRWWAIVDTAAPWCVVVPAIADALGLSTRDRRRLSTRFGVMRGEVHRVPLILLADAGGAMRIDATVFASADWPGPNFVGYQGFLERLRFAVDPRTRRFYFGKL